MQAESRTNLFDYAEAQLIFVKQRYNIGIAVVKYFGNLFRAAGIFLGDFVLLIIFIKYKLYLKISPSVSRSIGQLIFP